MRTFNLVKSLTKVNNITSLPFRKGLGLGRLILCLSLAVLGVDSAWGAWSGSGQAVSGSGTTWYVYDYATEQSKMAELWEVSFDEIPLKGPGQKIEFEAKREENGLGDLHLQQYVSSWSDIWSANPGIVTERTKVFKTEKTVVYASYDANVNTQATKLQFYIPSGSLRKYVKNVKVLMAQYIEAPTGGDLFNNTLNFDAGKVDDANVTKSFTIAWCNVPELTYTVTGSGKDKVSVVIENNSGFGKYNTATVKVTYNRNAASTLDATLTISNNTYNGYSKSIKLSGSTTKYDQSLSWENESSIELNMLNGTTQTIKAISNKGQTVTYTSSNSGVLSVDASGNLTAKSVGEGVTITASQEGNYKYNAATPISKTFNVKSKDTPIFTPNWSSTDIKVGDKVTLGVQYVSDGLNGNFKAAYNSTIFNVTREENTITIEALNEGDASVAFTQTETSSIFSASKTYSFSVSKIANTLTADATHSMKVDETWNNVYSNKNSDGTITTESTDASIAYFDVTNNKIVAQNSGQVEFGSTGKKDVTITISQAATYKYTAASKTITVTVNKHVPTFTWSNATLYHNQTYSDFFTTNCPNDLTVKSSSDDNVAYLENGSNAQKLNLKTLSKAASTTLTVTQAENYYWAEHTESKTITPSVAPNHVPFTYNEAMFNDGNITITKAGTSNIFMVDNGRYVQLGEDATTISGGDAWKEKYIVIKFDGIPEKVSFEYATSSGASTSPDFKVYESTNGTNFNEIFSDNRNSSSWSSTITKDLSKDTRYLKFFFDGNYGGQYQHIKVTELKTFSTDQSSLDFGTDYQKGSPHPTKKLSLNYANVGHHITLEVNNDNFTVNPTEITGIGGEKYGEFKDIVVEYSTEVVDTINATLTIKDELGNETYVTLVGGTHKKEQTLTWASAYQAEHPTIPVGKPIENAASVYTGAQVTYTSSNPEIIEIINDGTAFKAVGAGRATITAYQAGDDEWLSVKSSKEFITTYKQIQNIHWDQSFRKIIYNESTPSQTMGLTASVYVVNPATGNEQYSDDRTAKIQYTSGNADVVSVSGTVLTINGVGETTITASIEGNEDYESSSTTLPVRVRVPSIGCDDPLLVNYTNQIEFFAMNTGELTSDEIAIDRENGNPDKLSFWHEGKAWKLAIEYYKGSIKAQQKINGQWQDVQGSSVTPTKNQYNQLSNLQLDRNATHIRFVRPKGGEGYHHIKDIEVTLLKYIETETTTVDFGSITPGSKETRQITVNYSNIQGDVEMTVSNSAITIEGAIETECGGRGQQVITIQYAPTTVETLNDQLFFRDKVTNVSLAVNLTGSSVRNNQTITWNPSKTSILTTETIDLNATTSSGLPVSYSVTKGSDIVTINNGQVTILKDGEVTVEASQQGNPSYSPATSVSKDFTITKDNPIITWPTATEIIYGQSLNESLLTGGVAVDHNSTIVTGSFSWKNGSAQLTVGNQNQIVVFTPDNQNWYTQQETTIPVTVLKADPSAIAQASEIIYGAAVETSVLTNEGTTEGTWTWTDEKKDQVLNVGTHEGLAVHFTPTDQTNYNEIDGTVSLTITAVTPELTWTAKPETAQVHEVKTFTASSTNTDNVAAITYSIISGGDCATIDASTGEVTMLKAGTITVQASQAATTNFNAATSITTTCTISKAPTEVTTEPQIDGEIVYGAQLSDLQLKANTGAARNTINQQAVEGTFAITDGDISTAGEKKITVTFTPANTDMYASCTKDMIVTVQKADPNAIAQASEIIYGAAVGTSVLTNEGTTVGTWTWTDEKKDQVLNVGTHEGLKVHFVPTDQTNYNEIDGTVSLTVKKATATLTWTNAPTSADVKDKLTYTATSNHSESTITYAITEGADCATIDANTGELTITKAGTITVQASQAVSANYEEVIITTTTSLTGKFENIFNGNGDWNTPENWSLGLVPTEENPDVVVSGEMTISKPISVGGLTIEQNGKVNIINNGNLTVNGTSADRETYGNLFVRNGGNVTIGTEANVRVFDFVVESSIGTQNGTSVSGQVANGDKVLYTNGAYIDINMDPSGKMDDTQWYGFTVPFPVDVQNGVARKEGDTFRKCTYGTDYMIAEYDMNQRLNTGKGWKYIQSGQLQPGRFYYFTVNGEYNTYSFKAADNTITIHNKTQLVVNGTGADANWNAVGNTTLTYATISGDNVPEYVQTYVNGQSRYQVVHTANAQFVVGCPFFFQAKQATTVVLNKPDTETIVHYAPQRKATKDNAPMCLRIAEEGKTFTDQMYLTASEEAQDYYQIGRDLVKAGVGTKSAQIWIDAYGQQLCVHDAALIGDNAVYNIGIYAPKNGDYEIGLAQTPTDGSLYLTQDGVIIWNLSKNDYPVSLSKGTTHEYGLLFRRNQPNAPTDIESMSKEQTVDKFIYQEHLYILKNGHLYNAAGATVKQNIRK